MDTRAFLGIVLLGFVLSLPGVIIDIDHIFSLFMYVIDGGWVHAHTAIDPVVAILYTVCWGIISTAFALRWGVVR